MDQRKKVEPFSIRQPYYKNIQQPVSAAEL